MSVETVFDIFPVIEIGDLVLRQVTYEDQQDYFDYLSNPEVHKYVPEECIPRSFDQTRAEIDYTLDLFRYRRSIYWALARKSDDKLIGSCGFNYWNRDHARAEISYDLAYEYWGKGIMSRVTQAVLGFAFARMQLHRVEATVTPTNTGSLKVLEKLGFQREGVLREQKLLHGKFYDAVMLSLLQNEYLKF